MALQAAIADFLSGRAGEGTKFRLQMFWLSIKMQEAEKKEKNSDRFVTSRKSHSLSKRASSLDPCCIAREGCVSEAWKLSGWMRCWCCCLVDVMLMLMLPSFTPLYYILHQFWDSQLREEKRNCMDRKIVKSIHFSIVFFFFFEWLLKKKLRCHSHLPLWISNLCNSKRIVGKSGISFF